MAFKEYKRATDVSWDSEAIEVYLKENGFLIGPGGLATGIESTDDGMNVVVRLDVDANLPDDILTAALDAYQPPADPKRIARGYLIRRSKTLSDKSPKDRTDAEKDVLAILVLLGQEAS
jgi:hypothetical protein